MLKDPDSNLPFAVDWTAWLAAEDDTADTFTWIVPTGITKEAESDDGSKATIWLSGGTAGKDYAVVSRITTTGGRIEDHTMTVKVREK